MSMVLVAAEGVPQLHAIIACLADQTVADALEIIFVLTDGAERPAPTLTAPFAGTATVYLPAIGNRGRAAASGVRVARAPVIGFIENHCFPERDWAERLLAAYDAHGDRYDGIGATIRNGNPETNASWASYALEYGRFHDGRGAGETDELPSHNTTYRRQALMVRDNRLEELLVDEKRLQEELRSDGAGLLFISDTAARHLNEIPPMMTMRVLSILGRRYGGHRAAGWGWPRRVAYALAFPLLSIPIARRLLGLLAEIDAAPPIGPGLIARASLVGLAHAAGEAAGYLFGPAAAHPYLDREQFFVTERLGGRLPDDPRIAGYIRKMEGTGNA